MKQIDFISGNRAVAEGVRLSNPQVIAAYPITPQSSIVEYISEMIANDGLNTKMIHVESEHSALSACIGSASVGARTFTASCSQGLLLMHECLFIASGLRLPMVMCVTNRSLSAPADILCDHSDAMACRDSGWIQLWTENCQEVLDYVLIAFKISEEMSLPIMVNLDGFILSHMSEHVNIPSSDLVNNFLPVPTPKGPLVLPDQFPGYHGAVVFADYAEEWHYSRHRSLIKSGAVIKKTFDEFEVNFGRRYDLVKEYRCEDAEIILVSLGTMSDTIREVVDKKRDDDGVKVGSLSLSSFRPFPTEEVRKILKDASIVAVLDKSISNASMGGPVFHEICSALNNIPDHPKVIDFIVGLGGRDVTKNTIDKAIVKAEEIVKSGRIESELYWPDARESILKDWGMWP
jgi:pyruvate ferredoxin oxidoreductase alpha subunit